MTIMIIITIIIIINHNNNNNNNNNIETRPVSYPGVGSLEDLTLKKRPSRVI
jgi:hypothetical protein